SMDFAKQLHAEQNVSSHTGLHDLSVPGQEKRERTGAENQSRSERHAHRTTPGDALHPTVLTLVRNNHGACASAYQLGWLGSEQVAGVRVRVQWLGGRPQCQMTCPCFSETPVTTPISNIKASSSSDSRKPQASSESDVLTGEEEAIASEHPEPEALALPDEGVSGKQAVVLEYLHHASLLVLAICEGKPLPTTGQDFERRT
ncbi:hypothetical protein MRX96_053307, partial [Rhipicephalus microplus]